MTHNRSPYQVHTVRGTPIHALDRTLVPVARVISATRHRATIRERAIEGRGSAIVRVRPLHVIEAHGDSNTVVPILDVTAHIIAAMVLAATGVALISLALIVANRLTASNR